MDTINDEIRIKATPAKAFEALTTQAGYRGWWNNVAEVPTNVGGEPNLLFDKQGQKVHMRYRIDEIAPTSIKWTCIAHDMPSWVGTTLHWQIRGAGNEVVVALEHSGWKDAAPQMVKDGWKHFLGSMKSYLETGTGQPW
ncbi:MAG TPA: SRPBCC domain-containing protein [Kofleriaceae bacterium]|jgi:uncharacterized protein YndB with AHSA1/START domain|nr:SRPBCC domain-containing protein [Kofleriaceae bacterium]